MTGKEIDGMTPIEFYLYEVMGNLSELIYELSAEKEYDKAKEVAIINKQLSLIYDELKSKQKGR